jgi:hypothetical protein
MMDMRYIRDDFLKGFKKLARDKQINLLDEWFPPPFPEDTIVINWRSEDLKKVMRIQEDDYGDDGTFQFNGFVAKSGLDYEYDDLCVIAVASNEKVHDIFDLYRLWFVENVSPKEMEGILESYFGRLNRDKANV